MAILQIGFGMSLPFGKSTTNKNNERKNDRMLPRPLLIQVIALMQDQVEGMSKIPDMKTAYPGH